MKILKGLMGILPREARRNFVFVLCFVVSSTVFFYLGYLEHLGTLQAKRKAAMRVRDTTFLKASQEEVPDTERDFKGKGGKGRKQQRFEKANRNATGKGQNATTDVIRILSWTSKFGFKPNWFAEGKYPFKKCDLKPGQTCEYTTNKDQFMTSDVVLFRLRRIKTGADMPKMRPPAQKWLFYESEPPTKTWAYVPRLDPDDVRHVFNLTSTYTQDSDISSRLPIKCSLDQDEYNRIADHNFAAGKTKGVAWFVSHCNTESKREAYAQELEKYINIDIYGACGKLKCNTVDFGSPQAVKIDELMDCDRRVLNGTYKFYLAFENSLCQEYVTEKLTRILLQPINIIPVVLGHENYANLLPPNSYIDVRDFESPQALAAHLYKVDKNDDLYNQYIRNKMALDCSPPREVPYECRLCSYLHDHKGELQVVKDVVQYWSVENKCLRPDQFYKGVADPVAHQYAV